MQPRAMSEEGLFLHLEPRPPLGLRGVDRLRLISAEQPPSKPPATPRGDDALAQLKAAGLACEEVPGPQLHLLGGSQALVEGGIRRYENAFAVLREPDGQFLVMVSGPQGHHEDEETTTEALAEAVEAVLAAYRGRTAWKAAGGAE